MNIKRTITQYKTELSQDSRRANRFYLLLFTSLLIINYLMICFHAARNPLNIFPAFPIWEKRETVQIYLPALDGKELLPETRKIMKSSSDEEYVHDLVYSIARGSLYENTRMSVPIEVIIRTVWIHEDTCIIDLRMGPLDDSPPIIPGSENNFRRALEKTITENVDSVSQVHVMENGYYYRNIWEIAANFSDGDEL